MVLGRLDFVSVLAAGVAAVASGGVASLLLVLSCAVPASIPVKEAAARLLLSTGSEVAVLVDGFVLLVSLEEAIAVWVSITGACSVLAGDMSAELVEVVAVEGVAVTA